MKLSAIVIVAVAAALAASAARAASPGRIAYLATGGDPPIPNEIFSINPDGSDATQLTDLDPSQGMWDHDAPAYSPDGTQIAYARNASCGHELFVMSADGTNPRQLTSFGCGGWATMPAWSADGSKLAFVAQVGPGILQLYTIGADGAGLRRLTNGDGYVWKPTWAPDGTRIAYTQMDVTGSIAQIAVINADGTNPHLLTTDYDPNFWGNLMPSWSPDGATIAFASDHPDGTRGIDLIAPDGSNRRRLPESVLYAESPVWSPDGRQIAFSGFDPSYSPDGNREIVVIDADGGNAHNITNTPDLDETAPTWQPLP